MKKLFTFVFAFVFFIPILVFADSTTNYFIEANIKENGDMEVRELKVMDGNYNGFSTTLRYKNNNLKSFSGILDDFEGSDIYNATDLVDLKVYDAKFNGNLEYNINEEFNLVNSANKGDYGVYTKSYISGGEKLMIYLPSSYNMASLVTYTLKNVVVLHNDVAEIAWDFIGSDYGEDINNLKIIVNLPSNSEELRVFSHGPLNGINKINSKSSVELNYDYLPYKNAVDIRVAFDKKIVPGAIKKSNINGLNYILEVEKNRADIANNQRDKERIKENIALVLKGAGFIWLCGLLVAIYIVYKKYDKEYNSNFSAKYFKDIPSEYSPTVVSYLMYKKIKENCFSATILDLITKKFFVLEEIKTESKGLLKTSIKKDYKFTKNENINLELTGSEKKVVSLLLDEVGDGKSFTLKDLKSSSKNYSSAKRLINLYDDWKYKSLNEAEKYNFYEDGSKIKTLGILYSLIFPLITFISMFLDLNLGAAYLFNIVSIISIIYFISFTRRTKEGNEEYQKWKALNNFMKDFGRLDEKDLPEVKLWEKYLVYATVFGIADKVQNVMKTNLENMNYNDYDFTYLYFNDWYFYTSLNRIVSDSISTAKGTISSHEIATSSNSSSGGFGGGSSFGGGGFGGGGSGGGRF